VAESEAFFHRRGTADQPAAFTSHQHLLMLAGLAFDPDQQRTGAGRRLVEAFAQEACARGARKPSPRVLVPYGRASA